ncbi:hypothetical protein [Pseudomonas asplenii]|uniref:hypothetical protein n=1 Tax=Pseudomonas asplenii TaxID=53407 RepID=UPI0018DEE46D|nr:hypothetical protein [Pseudomonas fuscovaginae]
MPLYGLWLAGKCPEHVAHRTDLDMPSPLDTRCFSLPNPHGSSEKTPYGRDIQVFIDETA